MRHFQFYPCEGPAASLLNALIKYSSILLGGNTISALCPDDQTCSALKRHLSKVPNLCIVLIRITSVSSIIEGQNTPVKAQFSFLWGVMLWLTVPIGIYLLSNMLYAMVSALWVARQSIDLEELYAGFERWPSTGKGKLPMANDLYSSFWFNPSMLSIVRSYKISFPDCVALSKDLMLSLGELPGGDSILKSCVISAKWQSREGI